MVPRFAKRAALVSIVLFSIVECGRDATTAPPVPITRQGPPTFDISDSGAAPGATVTGSLATHFPAGDQALSFTARIRYDTTVVRFVDATPAATGDQQAVDARDGLVRIAGISPGGFAASAPLAAIHFQVLKSGVRSAFSFSLDELHTSQGAAQRIAHRVAGSARAATQVQAPASGAQWQSVGPAGSANSATVSSSPNPQVDVGRVASIALDPRGTGVYVGAATGGVWRTQTLGGAWTPLSDTQCSLNIGVVAVDPVNPQIVYAGTGEYNTFLAGCGLLRSTDGGSTWSALGASAMIPPSNVGLCYSSIYIDSATAGGASTTLVVATTAGLYRSTNSGATWTQVMSGLASGIIRRPDSANVLFAGVAQPFDFANRAVYRSSDDGATWVALPPLPDPSSPLRYALAVSPAAPSKLFVTATSSTSGVVGAYEWDDDAGGWTRLNLTSSNLDALGNQAQYDLTIAVAPADSQRIYIAGQHALRSVDGGATFSVMAPAVHVDWHAIVVDAREPSAVYAGTDGGIYKSSDGGDTWTGYNAGLAITQFYNGIGVDSNATRIVAGSQDNGAQRYTGSPYWQILVAGDAGSAVLNPSDPTDGYAVTLDGTIWHFPGASTLSLGRVVSGGRGQLVFGIGTPRTLYYGWKMLYRSTDAGATWTAISPSLPRLATTGVVSALAPAPSDSRTIYVGTNDGYVLVTRDGAATFTLSIGGLPSRSVTHIAVDPSDAAHAIITMSGSGSGHVFETRDFGARWLDIGEPLGDVAADAAVLLPGTAAIFVGTDHGGYQSGDDGATWQPIGVGLPDAQISDLAYAPGARTMIAATYGRGMFALHLQGSAGVLVGDVNGDGAVDAYDALLVAQNGTGLTAAADANCDGRIDAADVTLILQAAVGLSTTGACVGTIR